MSTSPYAPIRSRDYYWWQFANRVTQDGLVKADGQIASVLPTLIMKRLVEPMGEALAQDPAFYAGMTKEEADYAKLETLAKSMEFRHWVPMVGQYTLNGRQIFDLHDGLTQMLKQTDLGDCTFEGLQLPYDCFYIHFGRQDDIKAKWNGSRFEYVDGAYIAVTPWDPAAGAESEKRYKIGLSMVLEDGAGLMAPGYFVDFTPDESRMPVDAAIDACIARRKAGFFEGTKEGTTEYVLAHTRAEQMEEGAGLARQALTLIFNSLFYLESLGQLPEESVGRDTSPELTAAWLSSKADRRFKVKQKLASQGYTVVRLVGSELADAVSLMGSREGVSAHWRRGFFRQQAHGPKMTLRRRIWVRPVIVNADKGDVREAPGHIYVGPSSSSH